MRKRKPLPEDTFCESCRGESSAKCSCPIRNPHEDPWKLEIIHTRRLIIEIKEKVAPLQTLLDFFDYSIDWKTCLRETGETFLHALCMNPNVCTRELVHQVICEFDDDYLTNIDARNALHVDEYAPIHYAVHYKNKQMLRALLIMNADVSQVDRHGRTALMIAAEQGDDGSMDTIFKYAVELDVTYRTPTGKDIVDFVIEGCLNVKKTACLTRLLQSKYPIQVSNVETRIGAIKLHPAHAAHPVFTACLIELLYTSQEVWSIHKASVASVLHECLHPPEIADSVFEYYS